MPKVSQTTVETEYDRTTGEVLKKKNTRTYNWGDEPPYIKMYIDDILYLKDLPKGYNSILNEFLKRMTYAGHNRGQEIVINSSVKRIISKDLGLSVSHINNTLYDLVKGQVLFRLDIGLYQVNPHLFGKGEWSDIAALRLTITYDASGKTVMSEVERKNKAAKEREAEAKRGTNLFEVAS